MINTRQPLLDILRGFAIFGIFFVNITIMHSMLMFQDSFHAQFDDLMSQAVQRVLQLFFYNKFFPIFSFLFGVGLSMQMTARINQDRDYLAFFLRRMSILFIIGVFHIMFLWSGDVLHLYAILGVMCLLFIKLPTRLLTIIAALLLFFPYYDHIAAFSINKLSFAPDALLANYGAENVITTMQNGSFLQTVELRWYEYVANFPMLLFYLAPMALAMFLLGIAAGKSDTQFASNTWLTKYKKAFIYTLIATSLYRIVFLWVLPETSLYREEALRPIWFKLMFLSDVFFGLCYLWGIAWLWHNSKLHQLLAPFEFVGRMALTNYLLQSVFGFILFYWLSLYQTLSPTLCFTIAFCSFILLSVLSRIWLNHFKYGPLEWLWRIGSYLKKIPIRIENPKLPLNINNK